MIGSESDKYGTSQRQKELLEMLKEIDVFLKAKGIVYNYRNISYEDHSLAMNICLKLTFVMGKLFHYNFKYRLYHKIAQIGCGRPQKAITRYTNLFKLLSKRYSEDLFNKISDYTFEYTALFVSDRYDEYLSTQYANYMVLVSEAERI